jgi:hypothetical protein
MTDPVVLAALVAVCGALLAISGRDSRIVVGGLLVAMIAVPLAASPEPSTLTIGFRVIGALLASYLMWMAARTQSITSEGSGIGIAAEALIATAAFAVGWFAAPVQPLAGPPAAQAAGFSLAALAVVPLAGRNVIRLGTAAAILVLSLSLLLSAWIGPMPALEQMVLMVLLVGIVGATSLLSSADAAAPETGSPTLVVETTETTEITETADAAEPTDAPEPVAPAESEGGEPANENQSAEPAEAPAKAGATLRTSRSRSPRAIRKVAPVEVASEGVAEAPASPATPPKPRVRLIHPREPRQ